MVRNLLKFRKSESPTESSFLQNVWVESNLVASRLVSQSVTQGTSPGFFGTPLGCKSSRYPRETKKQLSTLPSPPFLPRQLLRLSGVFNRLLRPLAPRGKGPRFGAITWNTWGLLCNNHLTRNRNQLCFYFCSGGELPAPAGSSRFL